MYCVTVLDLMQVFVWLGKSAHLWGSNVPNNPLSYFKIYFCQKNPCYTVSTIPFLFLYVVLHNGQK